MRSGLRLGGAIGWSIAALLTVFLGMGAAADPVQRVPLGGSVTNQVGDKDYGVYVPTRLGGVLTIKSTSGKVESIFGPERRERRNGEEVGNDAVGWYTFRVVGAEKEKPYTVETTFVQVGQSVRMPWNFYYWPTKSDAVHEPWAGGNGRADSMARGDDEQVIPYGAYAAPGQDIVRAGPNGLLETPVGPGDDSTWFPNLYDDLTFRGADGTWYQTPAPLLKYDQIFGLSARSSEAMIQNHDIQRWPGHCLGGAIASIMLAEPRPAPGSGMTQDELKALWAELGENHFNHQIGDNVNGIPSGPPRRGYDPTDPFVPKFHEMLETHIRGKRQALLGNLRGFPPTGKANEVWNHGIGKYTAKMHATPGNERQLRIELELVSNSGSNLNNSDNKPRINTYEYVVVYGADGKVDLNAGALCDFISVGGEAMFAPLNIMEVVSSRWSGHNGMVTEDKVRQLDLANGGMGVGRLASTPPTFRPVGSYEAGRAPIFARNGTPDSPSTTRRGLFRMFGGR
jgi:hypothetical protein